MNILALVQLFFQVFTGSLYELRDSLQHPTDLSLAYDEIEEFGKNFDNEIERDASRLTEVSVQERKGWIQSDSPTATSDKFASGTRFFSKAQHQRKIRTKSGIRAVHLGISTMVLRLYSLPPVSVLPRVAIG